MKWVFIGLSVACVVWLFNMFGVVQEKRIEANVGCYMKMPGVDLTKSRIFLVQNGDTISGKPAFKTDSSIMATFVVDNGGVDASICDDRECSRTASFIVNVERYDRNGLGIINLLMMLDSVPALPAIDSFWYGRKVYCSTIVEHLRN